MITIAENRYFKSRISDYELSELIVRLFFTKNKRSREYTKLVRFRKLIGLE